MKLLIALALAAAPFSLAMGPFVPDTDTPTGAPTKSPGPSTIIAEGNTTNAEGGKSPNNLPDLVNTFFLAIADTCDNITDISMEFHCCRARPCARIKAQNGKER